MFFINIMNINLIILIINFLSKINSNYKIQVFMVFNSIDKQYLFRDEYYKFYQYEYKNAYKITLPSEPINITNNLNLEDETKRVWYSTTSENEEILIEFFYLNFPLNFSRLFEGSTFNLIKINAYYDDNCWIDLSYMFKDCKNLISIDLSNFALENANNLEQMFSGCTNLKYLFFPKTSLKSDAYLYRMFSYCTSLTSIDLTNLTLSYAYINELFYMCNNLESVEIKGIIYNLEKDIFTKNSDIPKNENDEDDIYILCERVVDDDDKNCPIPKFYNLFHSCYYIDTFETISLKKLNLFDMKLDSSLNYSNSLEECLFYEYFPNFKKCSKLIGFQYCGNCNNNNNEVYCTKTIEGNNYNFFYLEDQLNIEKDKRTCLWSNNNGSFNNYVFDKDVWLKCNKRCETCINQSRSDFDHKCLSCNKNKNFYPYKSDYDDFINKKINSINCYNIEEVKSNFSNYFFNENEYFEKCDISCEECISKNICTKCSDDYYYIYEKENGSCFHYPLDDYELIINNNKKYFKKCDKYYIKYNNKLTINLFKENITETFLEYMEGLEDNKIGIIKADEFSNYFYNQSTNYSIKKEIGMPIFDFTHCIDIIKIKLNIKINIFIQIIEYNNQIDKNGKLNKNSDLINSTEYQLFLENGTKLDYSICKGLNMTVEKKVDPNKIDIKEKEKMEEFDKNKISIFDNKKIIDYCLPLILYSTDYSLEQRIDLTIRIKPPCDDDCIFQSFDSETYYSKCICPIKLDKDNDELKIKSIFDDNDNFAKFKELYKNGNLKYFKCFRSILKKNKNQKHNWLRYISLSNILIQTIFIFIFYFKENKKIINIYDNKIKEIQNKEMKINEEIINNYSENKTQNERNNIFILKENEIINSKEDFSNKLKENDINKNDKLFLKENCDKNIKKNNKRTISNKQKENDEEKTTEGESNYSEINFCKSFKNDITNFCKIFLVFFVILFVDLKSQNNFFLLV